MRKWILALVCTIVAGTAAGSIAAEAVKEAKTERLERQGCSLVIGNESEDVIYSVSVSYCKDGKIREAVQNQYIRKGQEAYFAIDPSENLEYRIRFQLGNHYSVEAELTDDFESGDMNIYRLTGTDGTYVLKQGED